VFAKSLSLVPILSHIHSVHTLSSSSSMALQCLKNLGRLAHSSLHEFLKQKTSYSMMLLAPWPTPSVEDLWTRLSLASTL
jgi:hypothetical protein